MSTTYHCDMCDADFESDVPDGEQVAEAIENFGFFDRSQMDVVCDDCYEKIRLGIPQARAMESTRIDMGLVWANGELVKPGDPPASPSYWGAVIRTMLDKWAAEGPHPWMTRAPIAGSSWIATSTQPSTYKRGDTAFEEGRAVSAPLNREAPSSRRSRREGR